MPPAPTIAVPEEKFAHSVENGVFRQASVSQMRMFHDCRRQWHYNKVQHLKIPMGKNAGLGVASHGRVESFYKTGINALGRLELPILEHLPERGPGLIAEAPFGYRSEQPPLVIEGIPFLGKIDLLSERQMNWRNLEIIDYKFSGDPRKWAAKAEDLTDARTGAGLQMLGYAFYCLINAQAFGWSDIDRLLLKHVYGTLKGRPEAFPVAAWIDPSDALRAIDKFFRPLLREMVHVAREPDVQKLPMARKDDTCRKFGGCTFEARCKGLGAITRAFVSNAAQPPKEGITMSFLSSLAANGNLGAQTAPQAVAAPAPAPAPVQPAPPPAPAPVAPAPAPAPVAPPPAQAAAPAPAAVGPGQQPCGPQLLQRGLYQLPDGTQKAFVCATQGGFSFRPLEGGVPTILPAGTPVTFIRDLGPEQGPAAVLPPDAPPSNPALAARVPAQVAAFPPPAAAAPSPAPTLSVAPAAAPAPAPAPAAAPAPVAEKPRRGRKPKNGAAPAVEAGEEAEGVRIFVNVLVPGLACQSLIPYVDLLSRAVLDGTGQKGIPDVRLAGAPLDYGKWKGALAGYVAHQPLPPGDYLVTGHDERIDAILPELQKLCAPGDFVVGVR